jgi:EAL domain-containing protein (putative c-di-GMP-specific phosphodiesterase class I)
MLERLSGLGIQYGQGWHIHRPEPIESVIGALMQKQETG